MKILFLIGLAAIVAGIHIWGMSVGSRDAKLMQAADNRAAIALCQDAVAYRRVSTGEVVCFGGPVLAHPLKGK